MKESEGNERREGRQKTRKRKGRVGERVGGGKDEDTSRGGVAPFYIDSITVMSPWW